mgnify:CR=1 FL=1
MGAVATHRVIRLLLVDDEPLIRAGLRLLLDGMDGIEVVGEAGDGGPGVEAAVSLRPDVVLMDLRMPTLSGIEATRAITSRPDAPAVVVLTAFDTEGFIADALDAGAQGFLLKTVPPEELVAGVRGAASGDMPFSPAVLRRVAALAAQAGRAAAGPDPLEGLSERERQVALCIADGLSNAEIAATLYLSLASVKSYIARLFAKLDVTSRVQVALTVQRADAGRRRQR